MRKNNIAIAMLLLFAVLFGPTECKYIHNFAFVFLFSMKNEANIAGHLDATTNSSIATTTINSTTSPHDERKVKLIFCAMVNCNYFDPGYSICYCCPDGSLKEYCHLNLEECRASCALCQPNC
jgi:hypothetical protein